MKTGTRITLEGYGKMKGETEPAKLLRIQGVTVYLGFDVDGETRKVPFRTSDGCAQGSMPTEGFQIPPAVLKAIRTGGKVDSSSSTGSPNSTTKGNGKTMQVATGKGAGVKTGVKKTTPATASKNGKAAKAEEPEEVEEAAPAAKTPAKATAPKTKTPAKVKTPEPAEEEEEVEAGELSPMELEAARVQPPAEGEVRVKIAPLMFRQLRWDELRPYPEGRKVPGFKAFKAAMDGAAERSYVYLNVGEAAAKFLVNTAFKNGFNGGWKGSLTGGFKRGAFRTATELAEAFEFALPAVIAAHAKEEEEEEETPPAKGKGKATTPAPSSPVGKTSAAKPGTSAAKTAPAKATATKAPVKTTGKAVIKKKG